MFLINTEKTFGEIQYVFMIKILEKYDWKEAYLKIIKAAYDKYTASS